MPPHPPSDSVQGTNFPNLGDPPFKKEHAEIAKQELIRIIDAKHLKFDEDGTETREVFREGTKGHQMRQFGIIAYYHGQQYDVETVEVERVSAEAYGWKFRRAWYYWVCRSDTHSIHKDRANAINKNWRETLRIDGYAGDIDAKGSVSCYHIDTLEAMDRFVTLIKTMS